MAETENLRTASAYINNQLLSRGLLRDGQTIDFAGHGKCDDTSVTAGRIISVVNDLILRRDRDADHRESLSMTMRSLRAENIKHINNISKLEEKTAEAQRKLEIATAAENAAKTQLKSAESAMRGLKEQLARTKALVAQTRTSCATEVRRRDRQIDTLKKQLGEAGRARGARANPAITTITITGNVDKEASSPTKTGGMMTDEYSLRGESTASLAKLSQNLSEENEAVLALMSQTMAQLREMSGLEEEKVEDTQRNQQQSLVDMSTELDSVMEHMSHILNNPSFVPIEEVVVREEEINRLKEGWVKMETRWKDAMLLIDGWRKRMAAGGSPIREDELKLGFRLGSMRLTGITSGIGDSSLAPLPEEDVDEEEQAHYGEEDDYGRSESESENCDDDRAPYDLEEEEACDGAMTDGEAVEGAQSDKAEMEPQQHLQGEPDRETAEDLPEISEQQLEAGDTAADELSRESTPLPEPPHLSPLRRSSSAGNRGSQPAPPAATTRRKEPQATSSSSLPAPTQRQRLASGALHVQKRGLEQPGRRPTRPAGKVFEAKTNTRPPTRITSLEEALLSKPAQAVEPEAEQRIEKQPAANAEMKVQTKQDLRKEVQPDASLRQTTAPTTQRTTGRPTPHKPFPKPSEPIPQQSPLTMSNIVAKLAASEADADRVRAKLLASKTRSATLRPSESLKDSDGVAHGNEQGSGAASQTHGREVADDLEQRTDDVENVDPGNVNAERTAHEHDDGHLKVQKRKRDIRISSNKTSRRRSTLSPMELETLIKGAGQ
ncbi:Afadin/alpha-actinin-binding protein [Akanthomyces lecanii RCEF 1005]|uniref:Afadin/alpha-actinin-binding protein n=1 Tax=Akanthomyces lecanii RCEF 1005 TaxID=1081108 RepID=A0A162KP99_CORDF|nr:Afadin/alpha-actinin-binding protein [Akanthomyces lecanii RCEF 1005]